MNGGRPFVRLGRKLKNTLMAAKRAKGRRRLAPSSLRDQRLPGGEIVDIDFSLSAPNIRLIQ